MKQNQQGSGCTLGSTVHTLRNPDFGYAFISKNRKPSKVVYQLRMFLFLGQGSISGDSSSSTSILTLVFFVGGVTYAEISALRFLSRQNDGHEYIVASTSIVNGNTLLQPLIEAD